MGPGDYTDRSDVELVSLAKQGNGSAFGELYTRYYKYVSTVCRRVLGEQYLHMLDDLTDDTFVRAYTRIEDLEDIEKFKPWIGSIARNLCINSKTRERIRVDLVEDLIDPESDPESDIEREQIEGIVREAINALPEEERICIELHYFGRLSIREISAHVNKGVQTVKTRLYRARKKLRTQIYSEYIRPNKYKERRFIFSIHLDSNDEREQVYLRALNDRLIPQGVFQEFKKNQTPLHQDSKVSVISKDREWLIHGPGEYTIIRGDRKLDVYKEVITIL